MSRAACCERVSRMRYTTASSRVTLHTHHRFATGRSISRHHVSSAPTIGAWRTYHLHHRRARQTLVVDVAGTPTDRPRSAKPLAVPPHESPVRGTRSHHHVVSSRAGT